MGMCTEKVKMKSNFIFWAVLIVSVLLNVFLATIVNSQRTTDISADPLVVHDTIRIVEPQIVKEEVVRYEMVILPVIDTIVKIDTIDSVDSAKVVIPITERTYEDSTYKAVVRGYNPELVSLDIYRQQTTVYRQQTRKPKVVISAGVYGGFGVKGADYGLGISVGVPIWSW